ncbi:MAG: ABC transporter substrate-binding protein [Corynebacterium variabile]|nr:MULTISPECIES: ABC transporter substrate-binding protein [Corynebacterium]MDN5723516.1 ABC transporter substrate-binding protein [Corynebacterium sp.]MDN6282499.1 ABC transporter substrate-binding protein [Corynebacterium sp.]MDN6306113.1 ABC transporter substrate-binding protein [Corynebacterium sp.]MDN6368239.1 ABC transporter substrate-binding protein [Corynebacterium sp.]MDN6375887.1 ABC transporter substrate-binding protein [Corynebacterium sp.]
MTLRTLTARRVRRTSLALAATVGVLAASACSSDDDSESNDTHTVSSAYGDVEVPENPERVVAVSYDTPWQLKSLGVTPVAAQDYSDYSDGISAEQKEFLEPVDSVGKFFELDIEAVAKAEPDVIVGDVLEIDQEIFDKLSEIAPTVIAEGETRGDWKPIVGMLADAVGAQDALEDSKVAYEDRLATLQADYKDVLADNTFADIGPMEDAAKFYIAYPSSIVGAIYQEIGMKPAASLPTGEFPKGWEEYSTEKIGELLGDADAVTVTAKPDGTVDPVMQSVLDNTLFKNLKAAKDDHVFPIFGEVTDYESATAYLDTVEEKILKPLQK